MRGLAGLQPAQTSGRKKAACEARRPVWLYVSEYLALCVQIPDLCVRLQPVGWRKKCPFFAQKRGTFSANLQVVDGHISPEFGHIKPNIRTHKAKPAAWPHRRLFFGQKSVQVGARRDLSIGSNVMNRIRFTDPAYDRSMRAPALS